MNGSIRWASRAFGCFLWLFPRPFRAEFEAEMQAVFDEALETTVDPDDSSWASALAAAKVLLHETIQLPAAVWNAARYRPEQLSGERGSRPPTAGEPVGLAPLNRWEIVWATLPFLLYGLAYFLVYSAELALWPPEMVQPLRLYAAQSVYLACLAGVTAGWVKGFPRWSYASLGMALHFALDLFNENFDFWLVRQQSWLALAAALLIGFMITRSLRPAVRLVQSAWQDWSRVSLALYAMVMPVYSIIIFDGRWGAAALANLELDTLLLAGGAAGFMTGRSAMRRAAWLQAAVFFLALKGFWLNGWFGGFGNAALFQIEGWQDLLPLALILFLVCGLMFVPGLVGLARWALPAGRSGSPPAKLP